jgi:UrcA family protein
MMRSGECGGVSDNSPLLANSPPAAGTCARPNARHGAAGQISLENQRKSSPASAVVPDMGASQVPFAKETLMNSTRIKRLDFTLPALFGLMAAAGLCASAHGEETGQIVVRGSTTQTLGYGSLHPLERSTVRVGVTYDPATLTTHSGVALLKDAVAQAAFKACIDADPAYAPESRCMTEAIRQAQPQIAQAVARARSGVNG